MIHSRVKCCVAVLLAAVVSGPAAKGQEVFKQGGWLIESDEQTGVQVQTMEMTLHASAEPIPALKYRFLPDDFEMLDGNAATYYLKAQGFFEQSPARERLTEIYAKAQQQARRESKSMSDLPPISWLDTAPEELPVKEVKEFLRLLEFQPMFLREAVKQRRLTFDRNIRSVHDPFLYLLPEIQAMRDLARMQSLRCRVAIAEGRTDDAIEILGQQFALARHLGQDDFIVTTFVGMAISGMAWHDALHLVRQSGAPNLYWAVASLPNPVVDVRHALSVERQFLYLQFKALREVDETLRPAGYWQDFLDRIIGQMGSVAGDFGLSEHDPETNRALLVGYIAAAYPGARRYLLEELGLPPAQVEAYPTAQVVFLAVVRFYDATRDEYAKWALSDLPYWQSPNRVARFQRDNILRRKVDQIGWSSMPTDMMLPAVEPVHLAVARNQQGIALLQTVEAIRMFGARNDGRLPNTLDELPVPAPLNPLTGGPFSYEYHGDRALLSGRETLGLQQRLLLRFAKER